MPPTARTTVASRKVWPIGGWRAARIVGTILSMIWLLVLIAICPLVSIGAERIVARLPADLKR